MDVLATVKGALAMMAEGRSTIASIVDAVRDGKTALSTKDMGELNALLAQEQRETEAAHTRPSDWRRCFDFIVRLLPLATAFFCSSMVRSP